MCESRWSMSARHQHMAHSGVHQCRTCWANASSLLQEVQRRASQFALPAGAEHDVAANAFVPAYTLFPHADLPNVRGHQCSVSSSDKATSSSVTSCTSRIGECCVNYTNLQLSSNGGVRHAGHQACMCTNVHQALSTTSNCTVTLS